MAFSGCGTAKITEFEMPEGGYDGRTVEITFANTTGSSLEKVIDYGIERFNKIYPNIKVKNDNSEKDWDLLSKNITTKIQTGRQPNVAFCYPDHVASYNDAKAVLALDDFLPGGAYASETVAYGDGSKKNDMGLTKAQVDDYVSAFIKEGSIYLDGKTYTLPFAKSTEVLFYNKDVFDELELEVPTTWEEMEAVCKKITEYDEKCIALGYDSEANFFITLCEQYRSKYTSATGDHFLFDNDINRGFVKDLKSWYDARYLTTKNTYGAYSSNLFKEKKCYMSIGSTGGSSYQDPGITDGSAAFTVGVAPIPQVDPANPKVILQGPSVCVFKNQDPYKVLASWLLVKFLTTDVDFQARYSEISGYAPVTHSTFNDEFYQEFLGEADKATGLTARTAQICKDLSEAKCADGSDVFYISPAFIGSSTARSAVGVLLKTVLDGDGKDTTLDKAFKEALQECRYFQN